MQTYTIEVTKDELDAIEKGVELWEREPGQSNLVGAVFGAVLGPKEGDPAYAKYRNAEEERNREAERAMQKRKITSLRLRAKLMEVAQNPKEFAS